MKKILSFDCASKSLGVSIVKIDGKIELELYETINILTLDGSENRLITETTTTERSKLLKKYLKKFDNIEKDTQILIEYQMDANDKSREIYHYLIYHFSDFSIELFNPKLKNKIHFGKYHISDYYAKYANSEYARKKHSSDLGKYFCSELNLIGPNIGDVRNKKDDDCAEALLQTLAFLKKKYNIDIDNIEIFKSDIVLEDKVGSENSVYTDTDTVINTDINSNINPDTNSNIEPKIVKIRAKKKSVPRKKIIFDI